MRGLILLSFLLIGCKSLEYPVVTRYKEGKVKYVRVKEKTVKYKKNPNRDIIIFAVGTVLGFYYIETSK